MPAAVTETTAAARLPAAGLRAPRRPVTPRLRRLRPGPTLLALLALYGCWGASVPAMKLMVATAPPLAAAGAVFLLGGLVLALAAARRGARPTAAQVRGAALAGAVMLVGGQGLATVALTRLTTSLVAMLEATIPLWMVIISRMSGTRIARGSAVRVLIGFAGIAAVIATAPRSAIGGSPWAVGACCIAPVLWALGSLLQARRDALPVDPVAAGAVQLIAGGLALLALAAVAGQLSPHAWAHLTGESIAAGAALLVLDSLAGFSLYTQLLRSAPAPLVSTYAYVTPLVAILIGTVAFGDSLWWGAAAGGVLVIATIALEIRSHS